MSNLLHGTRILICQTCPRLAVQPAHPRTAGADLSAEIVALIVAAGGDIRDHVRFMNCLAGCNNPCNVALVGAGKPRLRFSQLGPGDGSGIIETAKIYGQSRNGELSAEQLPAAMRDRLSARSPVRLGD
ncbi:MAG: DUF1636 family protein [Rhodospirillaceae bacterium]|jgi:predicted metal-binding protein|nr:DUF1636 family protein [Rhodospirillaceae bacterium]MBT3494616.1 DUF1636 family protein [Rhodospirillaceae bacterium]MBT3780894.1 DUF1636 family protein [Rhodospirillaceae bacterium]MBT3978905.1 DUF1636 family protein [Rhodospirillaceae bacterium]MBT4170834.1 DUF1636 family protein [Rhodospirillaceae bacterium]